MRYTTSDQDAASPDEGRTSYPLQHHVVQEFLAGGGEIGPPIIDLTVKPRDEFQEQVDFLDWYLGDRAPAEKTAEVSTSPDQKEGGGAGDEEADEGEPVPDELRDTLARLVPEDADAESKKAALMKRLIDLEGLIRLQTASPADWAEYEQLTKYASWFK